MADIIFNKYGEGVCQNCGANSPDIRMATVSSGGRTKKCAVCNKCANMLIEMVNRKNAEEKSKAAGAVDSFCIACGNKIKAGENRCSMCGNLPIDVKTLRKMPGTPAVNYQKNQVNIQTGYTGVNYNQNSGFVSQRQNNQQNNQQSNQQSGQQNFQENLQQGLQQIEQQIQKQGKQMIQQLVMPQSSQQSSQQSGQQTEQNKKQDPEAVFSKTIMDEIKKFMNVGSQKSTENYSNFGGSLFIFCLMQIISVFFQFVGDLKENADSMVFNIVLAVVAGISAILVIWAITKKNGNFIKVFSIGAAVFIAIDFAYLIYSIDGDDFAEVLSKFTIYVIYIVCWFIYFIKSNRCEAYFNGKDYLAQSVVTKHYWVTRYGQNLTITNIVPAGGAQTGGASANAVFVNGVPMNGAAGGAAAGGTAAGGAPVNVIVADSDSRNGTAPVNVVIADTDSASGPVNVVLDKDSSNSAPVNVIVADSDPSNGTAPVNVVISSGTSANAVSVNDATVTGTQTD